MGEKRLIINIHYLEIGGAEAALIGLLHALDPSKYKIDLIINDPRGELMNFIPAWVNILPTPKEYNYIERPIKEAILKGHLGVAFGRIQAKIAYSFYSRKHKPKDGNAIFGFVGKYVTPLLPSLKKFGSYDLAISWLTPHNIVLKKIDAKKKVCWIHTDYSAIDINKKIEFPIWNGCDKIISISDKVSDSFYSVFPELKYKIVKIENFLPIELIRKRAEEFIPAEMIKENDENIFLSIGRYCEAKNLDIIPFLCRDLIDHGVKLKWFIIGYGPEWELNKIHTEIKRNNVEKEVILLGKIENPYPYIKACDWYVQPSRYEGKSITVQEAQILGKPVIIRNYPTASSQVKQETDGFIAPYDINLLAEYTFDLIQNNEDRVENVKRYLSKKDFTQQDNLQKFYSI